MNRVTGDVWARPIFLAVYPLRSIQSNQYGRAKGSFPVLSGQMQRHYRHWCAPKKCAINITANFTWHGRIISFSWEVFHSLWLINMYITESLNSFWLPGCVFTYPMVCIFQMKFLMCSLALLQFISSFLSLICNAWRRLTPCALLFLWKLLLFCSNPLFVCWFWISWSSERYQFQSLHTVCLQYVSTCSCCMRGTICKRGESEEQLLMTRGRWQQRREA